jgi:hypothetical protein
MAMGYAYLELSLRLPTFWRADSALFQSMILVQRTKIVEDNFSAVLQRWEQITCVIRLCLAALH